MVFEKFGKIWRVRPIFRQRFRPAEIQAWKLGVMLIWRLLCRVHCIGNLKSSCEFWWHSLGKSTKIHHNSHKRPKHPNYDLLVFPRNVIRIRMNSRNTLHNAPSKNREWTKAPGSESAARICPRKSPPKRGLWESYFLLGIIGKTHTQNLQILREDALGATCSAGPFCLLLKKSLQF